MPFDVQGAKQAGYSSKEIADFVASSGGFDVNGARKYGYNDDEIVGFLEQPAAEQPKPEQSIVRTALDQGLQGATFGFADELTDRLGAGIASVATGEKYDDLLKEARGMSKERMQQQVEQNPLTAIGANIGGALLTGGAGATTKAGTATANMLRSGNAAWRIGKGALAGASSGALYGAGASDDGQRLEGAEQGAILGGLVGGAIPAVGAAVKSSASGVGNIVKGATARGVDELDEASNALRQKSGASYQAMRDAGAIFKPEASQGIVSKIDTALKSDGILNQGLHGKTMSVLDDMRTAAKANDFGLEKLDQWRQLLGEVVSDGTDKIKGVSSDARKAQLAIRQIDDIVDGLDANALSSGSTKAIDALRGARAEWAKARRFESVANIIKKSDGDANYLKRELKKLADDPRRTRGWKTEEVAALREASRLSAGEGMMKMLGKFGFDLGNSRMGSGVGAVVGGFGAGAAAGTGAGIAAPIVGTAARYGQKAIGRGKAETLLNVIEGTAKLPQVKQAISPVLSAPAGAASGAISGAEQSVIRPNLSAPVMSVPLPPRSDNFDNSVNFVMDIEGGYVADDAGKGETNMGVNKTANPDVDIKNLTPEYAKEVYKKRYWSAIEADKMKPEMALVAFDAAVNHGVGKAKSLIHAAQGDPQKLLRLREMEYARLVKSNPQKYAQYAQGWIDRLKKLQSRIA